MSKLPQENLLKFSFVQITDHHLGESDDDRPYGYPAALTFRAVMNQIATRHAGKIDFIVSTGDLVNRPTDTAYQYVIRMLDISRAQELPGPHNIRYGRLWDFPLYLLPGNHDDRGLFFRNFYQDVPQRQMNASFRHNGFLFVCLDFGPFDRGELTDELLEYARIALSEGEPAILLMHHNIIPMGTPWLDRFIPAGIESLYEILRGKNVKAMLCGHLHTSFERSWEGIQVLGLRSTAFQFRFQGKPVLALQQPHYRLVTVFDNQHVESKVVKVALPAGLKEDRF